jgi:hypothetical protein
LLPSIIYYRNPSFRNPQCDNLEISGGLGFQANFHCSHMHDYLEK